MDAAPPGSDDALPINFDDWPRILADRLLSDGRHLVLRDIDGFHHVWLRDTPPGAPLAYVIVRDAAIEMRRQAAWRLDRRLAGAPPLRKSGSFRPMPRQRRRLNLLLDILDLIEATGAPARSYDIALRLLYPDMAVRRGADWKSSNQRRRTMRLIEQARFLMRGGYRDLLRGTVKGVTKISP